MRSFVFELACRPCVVTDVSGWRGFRGEGGIVMSTTLSRPTIKATLDSSGTKFWNKKLSPSRWWSTKKDVSPHLCTSSTKVLVVVSERVLNSVPLSILWKPNLDVVFSCGRREPATASTVSRCETGDGFWIMIIRRREQHTAWNIAQV